MQNNNALVIKNQLIPSENEFQTLQSISRMAATSGLYTTVGAESKILMILLAARELGISPMIALNGGIWNIQGKIEISARLMNSMIRRAGHSMTIKQCDSTICIMEGKRGDNGDSFTSQFSIQDAQKAGLTNRAVWKSYTEDMLYARAMSRLARRLFPDVIGTAYVEGEIAEAKFEILDSIKEEEPKAELTEEEKQSLIDDFTQGFPLNDPDMIKQYLEKYANHWKKSIDCALKDYHDREKFLADFTKWEKKQAKKEE